MEQLVASLRTERFVTPEYVSWRLVPSQASTFAFHVYIYSDGEPQIVAAPASVADAGEHIWSRPFEEADFSGEEARAVAFIEVLRSILTHRTRLVWHRGRLAARVRCEKWINERWEAVWETIWARTATPGFLSAAPRDGCLEAEPVAVLAEDGLLRRAP